MGLTFLQPMFLLGALATAIPVLIHLIYRRRALVHYFPAVRFLLLADKRTARKFRVHQWLLLALRLLVLLLLALVLARPYLSGKDAQAAATLPPQTTVFLVDNSLSMQYRDEETTRLQRAVSLVRNLLRDLRPQDRVAVLPLMTAAEATTASAVLRQDATTVQEELAAISPSHAAVDLSSAFQRAFTLLQQGATARRRIVVVSDFTVHGWEDMHLSQLAVLPQGVELYFIRVGSPQRDANVLVEHIGIAEQPFIEHIPVEVTALVRNRGTEAVHNLRIDLFVAQQKIGQQLVNLRPNEQVAIPFRFTAPASGLHWGEIRLEGDRFTADDSFYFALRTAAPARALIVDGDPGISLFDSEIFYLLSALQPQGTLGQPVFYPTPVTWEGLGQARLADYDVIVLCNVEALPSQVRQRLHQFVVAGGGVVFFAGNRVQATRYNAMFYGSDTLLLPAALGPPDRQPDAQPMAITTLDSSHEALRLFADEATLLQRAQFYRYVHLEDQAQASGVRTLLAFQNSHPLLVEKDVGKGKVMFFTSSADRDWTDLPTRTAYVPLLHGLVGYLANLTTAVQRPSVVLPEPILLRGRQTDAGATLTIRTADGKKRLARYTSDATEVVADFSDYTVPGIYHLATPSGPDFLAVNATRAESDFEKLQRDDLQTRFHPLPILLQEESSGTEVTRSPLPSFELAGMLMLILVATLAVENVCANRF